MKTSVACLLVVLAFSAHGQIMHEEFPLPIRSEVIRVLESPRSMSRGEKKKLVRALYRKLKESRSQFLRSKSVDKKIDWSTLFQMQSFLASVDLDSEQTPTCDSVETGLRSMMSSRAVPGEYEPAYSIVHELIETFCEP